MHLKYNVDTLGNKNMTDHTGVLLRKADEHLLSFMACKTNV